MESEVRVERGCPQCASPILESEQFCTRCGAATNGAPPAELPSAALVDLGATADAKLRSARKWLLAISILTLVSGLIFFAVNKSQVEQDIREAELQTAQMDPRDRDEAMRAEIGMTWEEAIAHDRGMVNLMLAINLGLAFLYLLLWLWAKQNPLGAAVTALMLFVTTNVVSMVIEPRTIAQGIIVKVFFTAVLIKAISAGYEARKAGRRYQ
jgi:hypothetical protein